MTRRNMLQSIWAGATSLFALARCSSRGRSTYRFWMAVKLSRPKGFVGEAASIKFPQGIALRPIATIVGQQRPWREALDGGQHGG
jgi:hypothetical protein